MKDCVSLLRRKEVRAFVFGALLAPFAAAGFFVAPFLATAIFVVAGFLLTGCFAVVDFVELAFFVAMGDPFT